VSSFVPAYRPTGSPLHRARPAVAAAFALCPAAAALAFDHPLVLAAALASVVIAGTAAGVGLELRRAAVLAVPLALVVALVNPLVSREGLTLLVRGPEVPLLGALDVTLEAVVFGGVAALRVLVVVLAFAVCSAAVDPDEMLRGLRRVAPRSALTASLATRMVPLLARDAERLSLAYGLRASTAGRSGGGRLRRGAVLARALAAGGIERSWDTAAALELRGYALGSRRSGRPRAPWSRDDAAFAAAAVAIAALALGARLAGVAGFDPYPLVRADAGAAEAALALALPLLCAAPFALAAARAARGEAAGG
jgi:energy-coupling factor transport system permease protein